MGKQRANPVTDDQIIDHYRHSHSVYKTATALGIGDTTVHRVLTKYDIPKVGLTEWRKNATMFVGREQEIRKVYESGVPVSRLNEHFGKASGYAFKYALRRAGAVLRESEAQPLKPGELDRIRKLKAAGMGQVKISLELGRSQSFISRAMRRHGISPKREAGAAHSMWKGGRMLDSNGYVRVWVAVDDPLYCMAMNDSHVLEHRLVMARKLGRPLLKTETVHHIDGDPGNNHPDNLQLRQGKHGKHSVFVCLDCGSHNIGGAPIKDGH